MQSHIVSEKEGTYQDRMKSTMIGHLPNWERILQLWLILIQWQTIHKLSVDFPQYERFF